MFSNFSIAKIGILLEDLSDCQNSTKRGPFAYNLYEACNVFQFFNSEDGHFTSSVKIRRKGGRLHIVFTKLGMFSNFSTAKMGILLADLSDCQNYTKRGSFAYTFYESCNVFQFFNSEEWHFTRRSF